jgi:hypothetical protein
MSIDETNNEDIVTPTGCGLGEPARQENNFLEATDEQLRAISISGDPSRLQKEIAIWTETEIVQTYDGPENAMFCANSANRTSAYQSRTQC